MFSYNDGAAHGSVEVYGDITHWEPLELVRVGESTQYAADAGSMLALAESANGKSQYKFKIDGEWVLAPRLHTVTDSEGNVNHLYDTDELIVQKRVQQDLSTTYLHHAPSQPSGLLIYIVPGNPGLAEYYEAFIAALSLQLPGADIVAPSHRGFELGGAAQSAPELHGLDEQVQHKIDFLAWFRKATPHVTRVALLGHSVGSWIGQRVAVQAPDIVFIGLLMPTVRSIAESDRGQVFTSVTKYFGAETAGWYAWSLSWIPFSGWLLRRVINRIMPADIVPAFARETSLRLIASPNVVRQIVALAIEEMQRIGPDEEPEDIRGFWDSPAPKWALFASHDHWVSKATREELLELAQSKPSVSTQIVDGLRHAFVIRESNEAAGLTARAILDNIEP